MAEHTPGPWVISDSNDNNDVHISQTEKAGMYVAIVVSPIYTPWPDDEKEKMANARLIAAAPDLLAFIKKPYPRGAYDKWRSTGDWRSAEELDKYEDERRVLIAKAEGEEDAEQRN